MYVSGRAIYEGSSLVVPGAERQRRDQIGGQLVTDLNEVVTQQATDRGIDPMIVNSVLRHEGSSFERRLLTTWPTMKPGVISNNAEYAQSLLQGDTASIGPAQMQLRRAKELEELGYATPKSDYDRAWALLNDETSIEYIAGMTQYTSDQLNTLPGFSELNSEDQTRLIAIGYNQGWEFLSENIKDLGFKGTIEDSKYDEETLDEYRRWIKEQ